MKRRWLNGGLASGVLMGVCWLGICGLHGEPPQKQGGRSSAKRHGAKDRFKGKLIAVSLAADQPSTSVVDRLWEQVRFEALHGRTFLVGREIGTTVESYVDWDSVEGFCVFDSRAQYDKFLRGSIGRALDRISPLLGESDDEADIRTIGVSEIDLGDGRAALGERLTEAVVREIENATPFRVSQATEAGSVLLCYVETGDRPEAKSSSSEKRGAKAARSLNVRWTDRQGNDLRPAFSVPLPTFDRVSRISPELGQAPTSADEEQIQELARQIVEVLEAPW